MTKDMVLVALYSAAIYLSGWVAGYVARACS